jgi:hypothetical protein
MPVPAHVPWKPKEWEWAAFGSGLQYGDSSFSKTGQIYSGELELLEPQKFNRHLCIINSQNPFQIHWFVAIKSKNRCLPQRCQLFLHHVPNLVAKDSSKFGTSVRWDSLQQAVRWLIGGPIQDYSNNNPHETSYETSWSATPHSSKARKTIVHWFHLHFHSVISHVFNGSYPNIP